MPCKGGISKASLPYDSKNPIYLAKCDFSKLLVTFILSKVLSNGVEDTLNELQTRFWISNTWKFISSVIKNRFICKKVEGLVYKYLPALNLPLTRVPLVLAFTHTGVDYAGPAFVKNIYDSQNMYKAWIFIFTWASSIAIFLGLVPSCDARKFINALKRSFSRYGVPETILSDNGTQISSQETQSFISSYFSNGILTLLFYLGGEGCSREWSGQLKDV